MAQDVSEIHYVVGVVSDGNSVPSPFTEAQVWCLDDKIRWRFHTRSALSSSSYSCSNTRRVRSTRDVMSSLR